MQTNPGVDIPKFDNEFVITSLTGVFNEKLKTILSDISEHYSLNKEKLFQKYVNNDIIPIDIDMTQKRKRKTMFDN